MGVQGLVTFVEKHPRIYRDVRFRESRLVIDGNNLIYLLYFDSGLDQNHGGEYAAFEELIERFVAALRDCGISPFVVLDGGSDYTDKKLETVTKRAEDRIDRAHRAAVDNSKQNVLPQLAKLMFRQTLARLEVPMAQCYAEADQEIAALAREWRCPVLSFDSDFYIFDLPAGFLPISHFQWEAVEQSGSQSSIPCKNYNTASFCIVFNIERQLLPTFAALAGNDYVKLQTMEKPIRWTQFCPAGNGIPSRLEGLLCWLRNFHQPDKAFEAALGLMGELSKKRRAEVLQGLYLGMEEYKLPSSALMRFFVHGAAPPFPTFEGVKGLVPDWTRLPLTQARLTEDILDVLLLQRNNLSIPVDHGDMPSANRTSRPLRQVMYRLLLGKRRQVNERDRDGLQLKVIPVKPAGRGVPQQLTLDSLDQAESSQRLQVLLDALGVTEASLSRLPPQLRLPVAVTCYWLQRAEPGPDESLLKALLMGLSNGDALRQRAASQMQNQRCKQKLDVGVVHAFNQWQGCLKDSVYLNQLLGRPLEEPQIARLYEGTLVHDLVHRMRTGKLKQLLKYDRSRVKQYKTMMAVVRQFHSQKEPTSDNQETVTPARRREPLVDLPANLQQLFLLGEDDEEEANMEVSSAVRAQEDLHLDDLVLVKTRYRAKERNNRSKHPELARKEECRGRNLL